MNRLLLETLFIILAVSSVSSAASRPKKKGMFIDGEKIVETDTVYFNTIRYLTVPPERQSGEAWVSGDVPTIKTLEDPIRREIFDKMIGATKEIFKFPNRKAAEDHFLFRILVIRNIQGMNNRTIDFWFFDPNPRDGSDPVPVTVNDVFWNKGKDDPYFFELKSKKEAFQGINVMFATKTRGECLGAIHASLLKAAADVLKRRDFNRLHPVGSIRLNGGKGPRGANAAWGAHNYVVTEPGVLVRPLGTTDAQKGKALIPGDFLYMRNKRDYLNRLKEINRPKKVTGFSQGENLIYIGHIDGENRFEGLGMRSKTEAGVRQKLAEDYEDAIGDEPSGILENEIKFISHNRTRATSRNVTNTPPPYDSRKNYRIKEEPVIISAAGAETMANHVIGESASRRIRSVGLGLLAVFGISCSSDPGPNTPNTGNIPATGQEATAPPNGKKEPSPADYLSYEIPEDAERRLVPTRPNQPFSKTFRFYVGVELVGEETFAGKDQKIYSRTPYKQGHKHGIERIWHSNGKLAFESPYKNGVMHGTFKQNASDGKLLGSYEMNEGTGVKKIWYGRGGLSSEYPHVKGLWHGKCRSWYKNRRIKKEVSYKAGSLHGLQKLYFTSGKKRQEVNYSEGAPDGPLKIWNEKGEYVEDTPKYVVDGEYVSPEEYEQIRKQEKGQGGDEK